MNLKIKKQNEKKTHPDPNILHSDLAYIKSYLKMEKIIISAKNGKVYKCYA